MKTVLSTAASVLVLTGLVGYAASNLAGYSSTTVHSLTAAQQTAGRALALTAIAVPDVGERIAQMAESRSVNVHIPDIGLGEDVSFDNETKIDSITQALAKLFDGDTVSFLAVGEDQTDLVMAVWESVLDEIKAKTPSSAVITAITGYVEHGTINTVALDEIVAALQSLNVDDDGMITAGIFSQPDIAVQAPWTQTQAA